MDDDGFPDEVDVCPFTFDDQSDTGGIGLGSGPDGIVAACQCGDADDDGVVSTCPSTTQASALSARLPI